MQRNMDRMVGGLCLFAALVMGTAGRAAEESPVAAAERALAQMEAGGKDVSALRTELDALRPEWQQIEKERDALQARITAFAPRIQALMQRAHGGGAGGPDDPIAAMEQGLRQAEGAGRDVSALRPELEALRPSWSEIQELRQQMASVPGDQRRTLEAQLRAKIDTFRPRMEALAQKLQATGGR